MYDIQVVDFTADMNAYNMSYDGFALDWLNRVDVRRRRLSAARGL